MKKYLILALFATSACITGTYRDTSANFTHVASFDANKYMGKWYQIARYPAWFEDGCVGDIAEYSLLSETEVQVVNSCNQKTLDGPITQSKGVARVESPGVLTVKFFGGFPKNPNYYVMAIDEPYTLAVVGEPDGKSGWILSRTPQISDEDYQWATGVLKDAEYDLDKLYKTPQPSN